jgi:serine/threonine protein kinase
VDMILASKGALGLQTTMQIFCNMADAVAYMHAQQPPVAHRDIKVRRRTGPAHGTTHCTRTDTVRPSGVQVENILHCSSGPHRGQYKLCDFGSATAEHWDGRLLPASQLALRAEEIDAHTTLSCRAPEQVDVYRQQPVDERVDIWVSQSVSVRTCVCVCVRYASDAGPRRDDGFAAGRSVCMDG